MKRFFAWAAIALLALAIVSQPASRAAADAPKQVIFLSLSGEPKTLDSVLTTETSAMTVLGQIMEGLVRPDKDGQLLKGSGAAADWNISSDGLTYTFTLKSGLKWSDGQPLRAQDFAYAWVRAMDPTLASHYLAPLLDIQGAYALITLDAKASDFYSRVASLKKQVGVVAKDDRTLQVTLAHPAADFLARLDMPVFYPQRQDVVEKNARNYGTDPSTMVFNGPFMLRSWKHDFSLTLAKNPQYWDAANVKLQAVGFGIETDPESALDQYLVGYLDGAPLVGANYALYNGSKSFETHNVAMTTYLAFNLQGGKHAYLQNVHIRRAISLALDREWYAHNMTRSGSLPATAFVPPAIHLGDRTYRDRAGDLEDAAGDMEAAQKEYAKGLAELGLKELPELTFLIGKTAAQVWRETAVENMLLDELNIKVKMVMEDNKTYFTRLDNGDFDLTFAGWRADHDDPSDFLSILTTDHLENIPHFANAQYDSLLADAARSQDSNKRLKDFQQAEQILVDQAPIVPLYWSVSNNLISRHVKGMSYPVTGPQYDLKNVSIVP